MCNCKAFKAGECPCEKARQREYREWAQAVEIWLDPCDCDKCEPWGGV